MLKKSRWVAVVGGVAGVMAGLAAGGVAAAAQRASDVPLATPPGITLVDVVSSQRDDVIWRRLGDADGSLLYTFDLEGTSGKSSCYDECAKEFPPFIASRNAVASGDWSLVTRPEGRQWAYLGRPLYRYSGKIAARPDVANVGRRGSTVSFDPGKKPFSPKVGWREAVFDPTKSIPTPPDVRLESLEYGNGYGFVVAATGMTIYELSKEPKGLTDWTPVYAPNLTLPVGDFSIEQRQDGTRQWAYKGQRLYTYNADYSTTDANGLVAQKDARIALARRFFMPASLTVGILPARPPLMSTTAGLTVYMEAAYHLQYGGHVTRGGYHIGYDEAKSLGTKGCLDECTKSWVPVTAPADAQSSGFWEVEKRADGSKQWAYRGSALYTYVGDKGKGDINGNSLNVPVYGDVDGKNAALMVLASGGQPDTTVDANGGVGSGTSGSGFYWHIVPLFPYN